MAGDGEHVPNRPIRLWHAGVAIVVAVFVLLACGLIYVNRVVEQSNHRWCGMLVLLDDRNQKAPPPPPGPDAQATQQFRDELHKLRVAYKCP